MPDLHLQVEGLGVRFEGASSDTVADLSFEIREGETLALLGPSGSGKTVTTRALTGLSPATADVSGLVRWNDRVLTSQSERRRLLGREAAMVLQDPAASLDPCLRIESQLEETLWHAGWRDRGRRRDKIAELLIEVRLEEALARRYPHQLSGGEQQRMTLALALATDPDLLIADEPTTSLDPVTQAEILALLRELTLHRGMALILVTHDLRAAEACTERALILEGGRAVETLPTKALRRGARSSQGRAMADAVRLESGALREPVDSAEIVLDVRGLDVRRSERRGSERQILKGVDLALRAGEALGVVGRSGAGKTTLAQTLGGFLRPTGGAVEPPWTGRGPRATQVIFQNPTASLDPRWTVGRSVAEAAEAAGSTDVEAEVRSLMADVGLGDHLHDQRPHALSGGEKQRVAIARALAAKPAVLVADEPASSLDPALRARLLDLLDELRRSRDLALILISHDLNLVRRCCPRIAILDDGAMVEIVKNDAAPTSKAGCELWRASV